MLWRSLGSAQRKGQVSRSKQAAIDTVYSHDGIHIGQARGGLDLEGQENFIIGPAIVGGA